MLGGTFDRLHAGHRRLLREAFAHAERVDIGLTTDGYLSRHRKPWSSRIAPYAIRRRALLAYLGRWYARRRYRVDPLSDGFGGSVRPGPDLLVASVETRAGAEAVNAERLRRGLAPLALRLIPLVRGRDGRPISSRRIRAGRIDTAGRPGPARRTPPDSVDGRPSSPKRAPARPRRPPPPTDRGAR